MPSSRPDQASSSGLSGSPALEATRRRLRSRKPCRHPRRAHRPEGRRRPGEVRHAELGERLEDVLGVERPAAEGHPPAQQQRADDAAPEAVGPAMVGDVPEDIVGAQVQPVLHVAADRGERPDREFDPLRLPGRARGVEQDHQLLTAPGHPGEGLPVPHRGTEVEVAVRGGALPVADGHHPQAPRGRLVELGPVGQVGDREAGAAVADAVGRRVGPEGGEERHLDGAEPPDRQQGDEYLRRLRQHHGDPVSGLDAGLPQRARQSLRPLAQLLVAEPGPARGPVVDERLRSPLGVGVAEAAAEVDLLAAVEPGPASDLSLDAARHGPMLRRPLPLPFPPAGRNPAPPAAPRGRTATDGPTAAPISTPRRARKEGARLAGLDKARHPGSQKGGAT